MHDIFFADTHRFVHDTVDGETIVLDSNDGRLFLFTGLGSWLWRRMSHGGTIDGVVNEVSNRFGDHAAQPTRTFLQSLLDAGLLRTAPAEPAPGEMHYPAVFEPPVMETYDDIADIISMDPIHEVHPDKGWPRRQDDESTSRR